MKTWGRYWGSFWKGLNLLQAHEAVASRRDQYSRNNWFGEHGFIEAKVDKKSAPLFAWGRPCNWKGRNAARLNCEHLVAC